MEIATTLIFGKWNTAEVKIADISLARYINLQAKKIPHTFGRVAKKKI